MLREYSKPLFSVLCYINLPRMWHELRVVLHNRENVLLSKLVQDLARDERAFADSVLSNWISLGNAVEEMPYE